MNLDESIGHRRMMDGWVTCKELDDNFNEMRGCQKNFNVSAKFYMF